MMLPARINIFYSKVTTKPTGERKVYLSNKHNFSSNPLTDKKNLFRRGLKFKRTPKPNTMELKSDIPESTRKI